MAEVALNIESRVTADEARKLVEDKVSRADFQYHLQNKPSFDDIKHIMDQMQPNHELYEDELSKMRARLEELYKEVHRKATQSSGATGDIQLLQSSLEQRFADIEDKLNDKANKQSVAQALHRKANKPEVDALLAKKAELGDLQRIISALENKIDISSFEALVRAVEMKPDRHELGHVLPSSYRGGGASGIEKEMDRSLQYELERRI